MDAHLLADEVDQSAAGRSVTSSPWQKRSIEIAASWPCATAQMMFLGPKAASPPKNTFGWVDCMVAGSTLGMFHWSNSMPMSRSIQGKAFSCPTATSTSSHSMCNARFAGRHQLAPPFFVVLGFHLFEHHAGELAALVHELLGHEEIMDRECLRPSHRLFPRARPSSPQSPSARRPSLFRRRAGARCGSNPSRYCRRPARSRACRYSWYGRTRRDASQSMPIWMLLGGFLAAGNVEIAAARRAAADEHRVVAFARESLSGCRSRSAEAGFRLQAEDVAALPRRARVRADGISGSACASCRRRTDRSRRSRQL